MDKESFDQLADATHEMKAIMQSAREPSGVQRLPNVAHGSNQTRFAVCIKTDDDSLLTPRKIYEVDYLGDLKLMALSDDSGEAAVYPADYFVIIDLPQEVQSALISHQGVNS
jgi:hypothetical protein